MSLFLALLLAATPSAPANPGAGLIDPLSPSHRGLVQCYAPDFARRSCISIGAYARDPEGVIQNTVDVLIATDPQIVMTTVAPIEVKHGAICGVIRPRDLATASFRIDGEKADADDAATIRRQIGPSYRDVMNRELCSVEVPDDKGTVAQVTVDGKRRPELDLRVRWISPTDGFSVKP